MLTLKNNFILEKIYAKSYKTGQKISIGPKIMFPGISELERCFESREVLFRNEMLSELQFIKPVKAELWPPPRTCLPSRGSSGALVALASLSFMIQKNVQDWVRETCLRFTGGERQVYDWNPCGLCHSPALRRAAFFAPVNTEHDLAGYLIWSQTDPGVSSLPWTDYLTSWLPSPFIWKKQSYPIGLIYGLLSHSIL